MLRFRVVCATDGTVEVGLEELNAIVFEGTEGVDLVFSCPQCGEEVRVFARVPDVLMSNAEIAALIEAYGRSSDGSHPDVVVRMPMEEVVEVLGSIIDSEGYTGDDTESEVSVDALGFSESADEATARVVVDDSDHDGFVEYFRRQLAACGCVDDVLAEIDSQR